MAVLAFYVVLFVAGSQDLIAQALNVSIVPLTWTLRIALLAVPLATGAIAYKICRDLARESEPNETESPAEAETEPRGPLVTR